jgi:hypothetical protein
MTTLPRLVFNHLAIQRQQPTSLCHGLEQNIPVCHPIGGLCRIVPCRAQVTSQVRQHDIAQKAGGDALHGRAFRTNLHHR